MRLKVSSAKWRPFCLGLNVLTHVSGLDGVGVGALGAAAVSGGGSGADVMVSSAGISTFCQSSPSSTMTAITVPSWTASVPDGFWIQFTQGELSLVNQILSLKVTIILLIL